MPFHSVHPHAVLCLLMPAFKGFHTAGLCLQQIPLRRSPAGFVPLYYKTAPPSTTTQFIRLPRVWIERVGVRSCHLLGGMASLDGNSGQLAQCPAKKAGREATTRIKDLCDSCYATDVTYDMKLDCDSKQVFEDADFEEEDDEDKTHLRLIDKEGSEAEGGESSKLLHLEQKMEDGRCFQNLYQETCRDVVAKQAAILGEVQGVIGKYDLPSDIYSAITEDITSYALSQNRDFLNLRAISSGGYASHNIMKMYSGHLDGTFPGLKSDIPCLKSDIYGEYIICDSFFWPKLQAKEFKSLKKWFNSALKRKSLAVDKIKYVFLIVFDRAREHWSLAVIHRPKGAKGSSITIYLMDSLTMNEPHLVFSVAERFIKNVMDIPTATAIKKVEVQVPQQETPDCAFFTLSTMEQIITGVNEAVSLESLVQGGATGWYAPEYVTTLRLKMARLIDTHYVKYTAVENCKCNKGHDSLVQRFTPAFSSLHVTAGFLAQRRSLTVKLLNNVMLEMEDMGLTARSSITVRTPRRRRRSLQELPAAGDRPAGKKAYPAPARAAVCPPRRPRCSTDATPASKILAAVAVPTSRPLMTPPARHPGCCRQRQVRLLATSDLDRLKDIRSLQIAPASDHAEMLYDAEEIDNSPREWSEVFSEACTIYQIVYGYALQKTPVLQRDVTHEWSWSIESFTELVNSLLNSGHHHPALRWTLTQPRMGSSGSAMNVALVAGSAEHLPAEKPTPELRRNGHVAHLAGDWVTHNHLILFLPVTDENKTMAATEYRDAGYGAEPFRPGVPTPPRCRRVEIDERGPQFHQDPGVPEVARQK
ncbi:hypothetical protein ZWY2020_011436 [Hordeum vulgare]|nr:hypothetical protein ZWY2020_011436 [Hordeum vulgare]